jgi:hypothetical protein
LRREERLDDAHHVVRPRGGCAAPVRAGRGLGDRADARRLRAAFGLLLDHVLFGVGARLRVLIGCKLGLALPSHHRLLGRLRVRDLRPVGGDLYVERTLLIVDPLPPPRAAPRERAASCACTTSASAFRSGRRLSPPRFGHLGLKKQISPKAMRRSFQDPMREAQVANVVVRSISGHLTEQMQQRYSTAQGHEQESAIASIIDLTRVERHVARGSMFLMDKVDSTGGQQ